MKKWYFTIFTLLSCICAAAQSEIDSFPRVQGAKAIPKEMDSQSKDSAATVVDKVAQFSGGEVSLSTYLITHLQYPPRCWEKGITGRLVMRFTVDTNGIISNIYAIEETTACPEFTAEVIRVLKASPRWIPAVYNGKYVKCWRQLPIAFNME